MLPAHNALVEAIAADRSLAASGSAMVAGSDAHTLRRVGPHVDGGARDGRARSSSRACASGLGRPGGAHGGAGAVAGDAYGVIASVRRRRCSASARATHAAGAAPRCLAFAAVSLPVPVLAARRSRRAASRRERARSAPRARPTSTARRHRTAAAPRRTESARMTTADRRHRHRPGHRARRDARGDLGRPARRRVRHPSGDGVRRGGLSQPRRGGSRHRRRSTRR